jgi:anthranilate/para-aminobenzoate synthase component II
MRVLVIDNYDSFTFNLVQYLGELGATPHVVRNDELDPADAEDLDFDRLLISPGPGRPENAGYSEEYIRRFGERVPTLGVCLGHQAIGSVFGGVVDLAPEPKHGKTDPGCSRDCRIPSSRPGITRWRRWSFPRCSKPAPGARKMASFRESGTNSCLSPESSFTRSRS